MLYFLLNAAFHVLHIAIILFVMTGWIFPSLRTAHLVLVLLTLGSWFVLGRWLGVGYCPVSDWHWKIKEKLAGGRPAGTYIHLLLQRLLQRPLNAASVDKMVVRSTLLLALLSAALNAWAWE